MHYLIIVALFLWVAPVSATWEHIGPHGGLVTAIVQDRDGNLWVGTEGSGIFKGSDGGKRWVSMSKGLTNPFVSTMAVTSTGVILAGTRGGLFKSVDSGETWQPLKSLPTDLLVSYIMVANETIYVAVWGTGVYKSRDGGERWEVLNEGLSSPFVNSLVIDANGDLYAGTEGGVFKSQWAGPRWVQVGLIESIVTTMVIDDKGVIYAGTWRDTAFKSKDSGRNWEGLGKGISPYIKSFSMGKDGTIYAGTEDGVYSLRRGEGEWRHIGLSGVLIRSVASIGGKLYAGTHGQGLYITKGDVWEKRDMGITNYEVLSMAFDNDGNLYAGTSWGLFKRDKEGRWEEVKEHAGRRIQALLVSNRVIYAGTPGGLFSAPTPGPWVRTKGPIGLLNITTIMGDGKDGIYVGTDGDGVFKGKGDSLIPFNEGLTNHRVSSLVMDPDGNIYTGTYVGVFKLSKDKARWEDISKDLGNKLVLSVTIDKSGNLYAGTDGGGVFLFERDGWKAVNEGLGNMRVFSIVSDSKGNLYAGTKEGIFLRASNNVWKDISQGLVNLVIQVVTVDRGDVVYIGTWGAGVCVRR